MESKVKKVIFNPIIYSYIFILPLLSSNSIFGKLPIGIMASFFMIFSLYISFCTRKIRIKVTFFNAVIVVFVLIILVSFFQVNDVSLAISAMKSLAVSLLLYIYLNVKLEYEMVPNIIKCLTYSSFMASIINIFQIVVSINKYGYKSNMVFSNPNYYAGIAVIILPLTYHLYKLHKCKVYAFVMSIQIISIVFSLSKSSIITLGVYIIVLLGHILLGKGKAKNILVITCGFVVFIACIFVGYKYIYNLNPVNTQRVMESFVGNKSISSRNELNNVSIEMIKRNFFTGVGVGNYPSNTYYYSQFYIDYSEGSVAHNIFLSVFSELGILGFIIYSSLIIKTIYNYSKFKNRNFLLSFVGVIIYLSTHGSGLEFYYMWIHFFISEKFLEYKLKGSEYAYG